MKSYLQFLGAGSIESAPNSLYYFLDNVRLLINVSEGTQRLATQYKLKLAPTKLTTILFTRVDWQGLGGLAGLILTMADAVAPLIQDGNIEVPVLKLVGPRGLKYAVATMRPFLQRSRFTVQVDELVDDGNTGIIEWQDEKNGIKISALDLSASIKDKSTGLQVENLVCQEVDESHHHFLLQMFKSKFNVQNVDEQKEPEGEPCKKHCKTECSINNEASLNLDSCFHGASLVLRVEGPCLPGKFDKNAAVALGVKQGPLFGQLSRGLSVELADGRVVKPEDCVGERRPSPPFVVVDVTERNLAKLKERTSELKKLLSGAKFVVHMISEESIINQYTNFWKEVIEMPDIQHYFTVPNGASLMTSSFQLQETLAANLGAKYFVVGKQPGCSEIKIEGFERALPLQKIHLTPEFGVELASETGDSQITREDIVVSDDDTIVTTLGTGAAIPGKYRNVSSTLVEFSNGRAVLLDCGESSLGQLNRLYGEKLDCLLDRLDVILISHMHADHHLGTVSVIEAVLKRKREIILIAPRRFELWLREFARVSADLNLEMVKFVACHEICELPGVYEDLNVLSVRVDHCPDAYGFVLEAKGFRVAYSGDTRPCPAFIAASQDVDLMVHEATMSDDLQHEAILRKHCTISEAISVGRESGAKRLLLTHFSQRYAKGTFTVAEGADVVLAVDLMRVPLKEFTVVAGMTARLAELMPIDDE